MLFGNKDEEKLKYWLRVVAGDDMKWAYVGDAYKSICSRITWTRKNRPDDFRELMNNLDGLKWARYMFIEECDKMLASGEYHRYRGELGFVGQAIYAFINRCIDDGVKDGQISQEELQIIRKNIADDIHSVG